MGVDAQHRDVVTVTAGGVDGDRDRSPEGGPQPEPGAARARPRRVAIIGSGPAGLLAAERLAAAGHVVDIYEQMPSPARKLLMAGRGGLNLTHSEPFETFLTRYAPRHRLLERALNAFTPDHLVAHVHGLGQETFVGSSGRVFPTAMKASPLLRAWLRRLDGLGVRLHLGHRLVGFDADGRAIVVRASDRRQGAVEAEAVLLACGGASWPRLGSDGAWTASIGALGVPVTPLAPANCGVRVAWSAALAGRHAGAPLKRIALTVAGRRFRGELVVTATGLEGGPVYAAGPLVREALARSPGGVPVTIDLRPDLDAAALEQRLGSRPRGKQSIATWLRKAAGLAPVAIGLMREAQPSAAIDADAATLARLVKAIPVTITGLADMDRAISTAGGIPLDAFDDHLMVRARPGLFAAGEMLDWEAPTGGYLLQATFATAALAADGIATWLAAAPAPEARRAAAGR